MCTLEQLNSFLAFALHAPVLSCAGSLSQVLLSLMVKAVLRLQLEKCIVFVRKQKNSGKIVSCGKFFLQKQHFALKHHIFRKLPTNCT